MKIKVLALALSMLFVTSIAGTTFAQMTDNTVQTVVVDDDKDKNKKAKKSTKDADAKKSDCKAKKSCCKSSKLKDDCKDDKTKSTDKDKR